MPILKAIGSAANRHRAKIAPGGGYLHEYIASFIGYAPVHKPRLLCIVAVDAPRVLITGAGWQRRCLRISCRMPCAIWKSLCIKMTVRSKPYQQRKW